jgi:hypothetical protein
LCENKFAHIALFYCSCCSSFLQIASRVETEVSF